MENAKRLMMLALACLADCYRPEIPAGQYRCGVGNLCPDGLACVSGWCGGPPPTESDAAQSAADMTQSEPDMSMNCSMCLSNRCADLGNGVRGCYFAPNRPITAQCLTGWRQPIAGMPFADDRACLFAGKGLGSVWLGYHRAYGTGSTAAAPPVIPWWNGQPSAGTTYRWISMCGDGSPSGWTTQANYGRAYPCISGATGERPSAVLCPRGATPSDADWDMVTTADTTIGVMCVRG